MSTPWSKDVAAVVVGLAVFELWKAYTARAPQFTALSDAPRGGEVHQQLMDADMSVGSLAVVAAIAMFALTRDVSILVLIILSFGVISIWHHAILNRTQPQNGIPS